jgi:hypothetical protein
MTRFLIYLILFAATLYFLAWWGRRGTLGEKPDLLPKPFRGFRSKGNPREIWVQVFETDSVEEGRVLQARLQEEEIECVLYEQGKKDIRGNPLKGIGVAVPKTAVPHAQSIINRIA